MTTTRLAAVSLNRDDNTGDPITQITYLGKTGNAYEFYPYGFSAVAPNETLGIMMTVGGSEDSRAIMPMATGDNRPSGLKPGEVLISNPVTGASVLFAEDGSIEVTTTGDVRLNAANVTITGNVIIDGTITQGGINIGNTHTHPVTTAPGTTGTVIP